MFLNQALLTKIKTDNLISFVTGSNTYHFTVGTKHSVAHVHQVNITSKITVN